MRRLILAALLTLAAPLAASAAAAPDAVAVIDDCIGKLDAQLDVGYARVAKRCPDLAPTLEQSGWSAWLPQGWKESRNDLSAGSLKELRALVTRELATHEPTRAPRVERLKEILTGLGSTGQQRSGLWSRFKSWVRSLFERAGRQNHENWLSRLISRIGVSGATINLITYTALGLVVALAGVIVFNELRLAGLVGRKRNGARGEGGAGAFAGRLRVTWSDVDRAALADRPRLLLELIATKLTEMQRLPPAGAFTVRELVRAADLEQPADREHLEEIALTAERVRYADEELPAAAIDTVVGHARALLARLESPEPTPTAAGARA